MEEKQTRKSVLVLLSTVFGSLLLFMLLSISSDNETYPVSKSRMDSIQQMPMDDVIVPQREIILPKQ